MSVERRDIEGTITDLIDGILMETDPLERFRLLEYAEDIWNETLGRASDSALWSLNKDRSINELVELTGWKKWRIEADLTRHRVANGLPVKERERKPIKYVPLR